MTTNHAPNIETTSLRLVYQIASSFYKAELTFIAEGIIQKIHKDIADTVVFPNFT
jgi:hypothetical protein